MTGQPIRDTFEVCFNAELTVMPGTVLPDLPGLTPEVSIDFDNGPRTYVTVNDEHCLFWTDGDEVLNSTEYESVWPSLSDEDREALLEWGAGVHERIDAAIYGLMIEATNAPGVRERIVRSATISNPEEEL